MSNNNPMILNKFIIVIVTSPVSLRPIYTLQYNTQLHFALSFCVLNSCVTLPASRLSTSSPNPMKVNKLIIALRNNVKAQAQDTNTTVFAWLHTFVFPPRSLAAQAVVRRLSVYFLLFFTGMSVYIRALTWACSLNTASCLQPPGTERQPCEQCTSCPFKVSSILN